MSIYPWTLGENATVVGTITNPVPVSLEMLSFTPGFGYPNYGYHVTAYLFQSRDAAGNGFSFGDYGFQVAADPNQPAGDGITFSTTGTFFGFGATIDVSDSARYLVSTGYLTHSVGNASGTATFGIVLPDGLGIAGAIPIVPELPTWLMLLIGFVALSAARRRLTVQPHHSL